MTKAEIVANVARMSNLPRHKVQESVEAALDGIKEALARSERVEFRGFGVFTVKERKSGLGRNLRTGEAVPIPRGKTVKFKPSSTFFD